MSITDELRKYVQSWRETPNLMDDLDAGDIDGLLGDFIAIADRIDAEHERQLGVLYRDMSDAEWVRLPLDADGEPIHIGDVMENLREDLEPKLHHRFKVYGIQYRDYGQVCTLTEDGFPSILYRANECRHHAPTVEDVLREMLYKAHIYDKREMELLPDLIAEYAAKLRLVGDAE